MPVDIHETSHNVQKIYECLVKYEPIKLYEFVINANSFGQTVENLFYLSFLMRDGKLSVKEEDGELIVETSEVPTAEQVDDCNNHTTKQNVLSINHEKWLGLIEQYEIQGSIIPHREPVADLSNTTWK
jgi:non-structural maintenance of chromosomes element 4